MFIGVALDAIGNHGRRVAEIRLRAGFATQAFFDTAGAIALAGQAGDSDAGEGDESVLETNPDSDSNHGKTGGRLGVLLVIDAAAGFLDWHENSGDQLTWFERGGKGVDQEIFECHFTFAGWTGQLDSGFEGEQSSGIVSGRIGMGDAASDGAGVADLDVTDGRGGGGEQRAAAAHQRRGFDFVVRDHPGGLLEYITREVSRVSGIPESRINPNQSLLELGIDSLSALELISRLEEAIQTSVPMTLLTEGLTLAGIAEQLLILAGNGVPADLRHCQEITFPA